MHPCESHDADGAVRSPGGLQEVFRENDSDCGVAAAAAATLRHLQGKDSSVKGQSDGWMFILLLAFGFFPQIRFVLQNARKKRHVCFFNFFLFAHELFSLLSIQFCFCLKNE